MSQLEMFSEPKAVSKAPVVVVEPVAPVIDPAVRNVCRAPYPGHPRGCPNWGREGCPPGARPPHKLIDLDDEVLLVAVSFNPAGHAAEMRRRHPRWSDRQCRNLLYWQGRVKKQLREAAQAVLESRGSGFRSVDCPEACGVNMTETAAQAGIRLKWPPRQTVWKMVLVGRTP